MLIKSIRLKNFKAFEDQTIEIRPLTLLTGLNGMGKSSVIQALLLLRQGTSSRLMMKKIVEIDLNGHLVELGHASDIIFEGAKDDIVEIAIAFEEDGEIISDEYIWEFTYEKHLDQLLIKEQPKATISSLNMKNWEALYREASIFNEYFVYLSAERIGPRKIYESHSTDNIGIKGEYAVHFLNENWYWDDMPNILQHLKGESTNLLDEVQKWMGEISPGVRIDLTPFKSMDAVQIQYSFTRGRDVTNKYRPTNVGFGISYVLPILVAILSAQPGSLIILENPEAHLHPQGQSKMGELMARAAAAGIQIICETHSDHILNGIRIAVKNGLVEPDKVGLNFFQRPADDDGIVGVEVVTPHITKNGRLDSWPIGFFDEWDNSLDALM